MKVYLIYDKTLKCFVNNRCGDGRKYLVYGDVRSARTMANRIKELGVNYDSLHKSNDVVVVEYMANIEHMREV